MDQPKYAERNAVILGASLDSLDSHKQFCEKQGLTFKLLADTEHKVAESYGSLTNLGVAKFASRNTFVIDPEGKVAKVFTGLNPQTHSGEALAALDQLQTVTADASTQ